MTRLESIVKDAGVCLGDGADPEWFVQSVGEDYIGPANRAVLMCAVCPVRDECLDLAEEGGIDFGVWGGMALTPRMSPAAVKKRIASGKDPRVRLLGRAVRALARARFESIFGRPSGRTVSDREEVAALAEAIEADLKQGKAPYELAKAAAEARKKRAEEQAVREGQQVPAAAR